MPVQLKLRGIALITTLAVSGFSLVGVGAYAKREIGPSSRASNSIAPKVNHTECGHRESGDSPCGNDARETPDENYAPKIVLSASGATGNGTASITLRSLGPVGSSFMTVPTPIMITNTGLGTAAGVSIQFLDQNNNPFLRRETWVCLYQDGAILFNEPLPVVENYGEAAIGNLTLWPGATDSFTLVYYAGSSENTGCGGAFTSYATHSGGGFTGRFAATEPYPAGTSNPGGASLTNSAQGGTITSTMTITFLSDSTEPGNGADREGQDDH